MSERLEGIKRRNDADCLFRDDIDHLIQQAEEKQKLEERVKELECVIDWHTKRYTVTQMKDLEQQNQRYKQVLEFYADGDNNHNRITFTVGEWEDLSPVVKDEGETARKALNQ